MEYGSFRGAIHPCEIVEMRLKGLFPEVIRELWRRHSKEDIVIAAEQSEAGAKRMRIWFVISIVEMLLTFVLAVFAVGAIDKVAGVPLGTPITLNALLASTESWLANTLILMTIGSLVFTVQSLRKSMKAGDRTQELLWNFGWPLFRLLQLIEKSPEDLVNRGESALREMVWVALVAKAQKVIEARKKIDDAEDEMASEKAALQHRYIKYDFNQTFELLKRFGLVDTEQGWKPYFKAAERQLAEELLATT